MYAIRSYYDYGDLAMVDSVPNNGSWDSFTKLTASQTVVIDASSVGAVQVKSVGAAGAWQWNLDYFVLSKVADLAQLKSHTAVEPRITSYNVCYTKLLR